MQRHMLKSKIHRATVTACELHYAGSITIDSDLMTRADLLPGEQVHVLDIDNGARFETYVIEGEAGSGEIGANGGAARLCVVGDPLIVISYCGLDDDEARRHEPKVILLGPDNQPRR